jgi:hypothetical protein
MGFSSSRRARRDRKKTPPGRRCFREEEKAQNGCILSFYGYFVHGLFDQRSRPMSVVAIAEHRAANGRFAPGQSGNPAGRPKGARNRATLLAEAVLGENGEGLVRQAIAAAFAGDAATLRFLVGRLLPPASADQPVALDLAPGEESDPAAVLAKTIRAMADGEIPPRQALQIGRLVAIFERLKKAPRAAQSTRTSPEEAPALDPSPASGGGQGGGVTAAAGEPPVSDLYFSRGADAPHHPLPNPPPHAGEGDEARALELSGKPPVSDLYFSRDACRALLLSTTAIGMAGARGVESPRVALPI